MNGRLTRLTDQDWDVLDRVLAASLCALMVLNIWLQDRGGPLAVELLLAVLAAAVLLWRRRYPLLTASVAVAAAAPVLGLLSSPGAASTVVFVVIVATYSSGRHLELYRALVALMFAVGAILLIAAIKTPNDIFFPLVFFGFLPWAVGRVIRNQTALARELTERAEREEIAREHEEAHAAAAERARVAREIHDVLAHNLSVMVIQASAARRIADRDPAATVEAAELISRTGREALSELRYVLGPVRKEDGEELGASPGLAQVEQLVSRAHRAGLPVQARVEGIPLQLSPGADLAAYRVVQEALTNTLKHARGARATVTVRYEADDVTVEVLDDGVGARSSGDNRSGNGHGLIGMQERVALYGGELEVGPRPAGGFAVRARLPLAGVPT